MYDNPFAFELVTPERILYGGDVCSVSAPGTLGSFQVLRRYAPFVSPLETGKIRLRERGGTIRTFATSGGFLEVKDNRCALIAESAESAEMIDIERAKRAKERAEQRLRAKRSENVDYARARAALLRAINRLKIAEPMGGS